MSDDKRPDEVSRPPRIEAMDQANLEVRLREIAAGMPSAAWLDDLELRHLVRVITECSLLLTDVYSEARLDRIMHPERSGLSTLVDRLIAQERRGEGEVFYRVRRLPDDVRVIGDKALFDMGILGKQRIKGYDLSELGSRAYRVAGEVLELLAEDRRLRELFRHNRLLMLPLEQEVDFLRQCSDRFPVYARLLRRIQGAGCADDSEALETRVPLMAAAADALRIDLGDDSAEAGEAAAPDPVYLEAARGDADAGTRMSRDELLSAYERMVLFAGLDIDRLRTALDSVVVDQADAVRALCDEFGLFAAGTRDLRKPPAYFLVGPTGVGKNHLVETLCRLLEGVWQVEVPLLTIEGPNYTYPSDINELRGATRGFIRSDEPGILTAFHERSSKAPFSVILVDEVEKAHSQLRTFFLSILDRGTTTDNRGRVLNFANSIVFFTSNLGYSDAQQRSGPIGYADEDEHHRAVQREIGRDLKKSLRPEFVNRLRIVHFHRLSRDSAERILDLEFDRIARRYAEVHGLTVRLAASAREELLERGFSPQYGARHMTSVLESICNVEIAKRLKRDDRGDGEYRRELVEWLRRLRKQEAEPDLAEVRRKIVDTTRASLDYDTLEIAFEDGAFEYRTGGGQGAGG